MAKTISSKPVAIAAAVIHDKQTETDVRYIYALHDNGTIWEMALGMTSDTWKEVKPYDHRSGGDGKDILKENDLNPEKKKAKKKKK